MAGIFWTPGTPKKPKKPQGSAQRPYFGKIWVHHFTGHLRNLNWRYLPYIRPFFKAYVSEYPSIIVFFKFLSPFFFADKHQMAKMTIGSPAHALQSPPSWAKPMKRVMFLVGKAGTAIDLTITISHKLINHPQNHHQWVLWTMRIWVASYCFTNILLCISLMICRYSDLYPTIDYYFPRVIP